jgi:cobyrinic acid a,c-diamide synthase
MLNGLDFPEMQLESLSDNQSLLDDIKLKIEQGMPTYAECGGLMYLSREITHQGISSAARLVIIIIVYFS